MGISHSNAKRAHGGGDRTWDLPPGRVLNFGLGRGVRRKTPNTGLVEWISGKFGGLLNWFSGNMKNCQIFSIKFENFVILVKKGGLVELKYAEKGVLWSSWGAWKNRGSCPPDIHITLFKVSTPPTFRVLGKRQQLHAIYYSAFCDKSGFSCFQID